MKTMLWALLCVVVVYLAIGVAASVYLKQTPYAYNPLWVMILLWPIYFI